MIGKQVTLSQILEAREERVRLQKELLSQYQKTLISFTMNIAGPVKKTPLICRGFALGDKMVRDLLDASGYRIVHSQRRLPDTGCEGYYVVDADPAQVKELMAQLEDSIPAARLFDLDVLGAHGQKVDREALGYAGRKCLLCEQPAKICGRSRAHSVQQLQEKTETLLREMVQAERARSVASLAQQGLLYEVCTTPKPGLVDRENSGSHRDMDLFTFMTSAAVLRPYLEDCVRIGMETAHLPAGDTMQQLRMQGKLAQQKMFAATSGVNTHKGAIFTMGILCGAVGRLPEELCTQPERVLEECAAMAAGITEELKALNEETAITAGQKLYVRYGITGVRGQAEDGFPAVLHTGLPVLERGLQEGKSLNEAGCGALLALMTATTDTNLIARSDYQTQQQVQNQVRELLMQKPYPDAETLRQLDAQFVQKNLSPGGSADLLAATYFLYFLKQKEHKEVPQAQGPILNG